MKFLLHQRASLKTRIFQLAGLLLAFFFSGCLKGGEPFPVPKITIVASGLNAPMGIETDRMGNVWIAETGTANNDGKIVVISPNRKKYDAIVNLSSIKNALSGEVEGPAHMLFDGNFLYILAADYLYKVNVSSLRLGNPPLDGSKLPFEDVGSIVRSFNIVTPDDSHPYNLIKGPDGDIYITDAGANAIIHRKSAGNYSVLAKLPNLPNPTGIGAPSIQCVPTGILFDGKDFLVSTLTGFPFPQGQAVVYKVSLTGDVSVYKGGFTTLVGISEGNHFGHVVLSYGSFAFGPQPDFVPNSGSLILMAKDSSIVLTDGLNMPAGLKQVNDHTYYITSLGDNTLLKVNY